MKVKISLCFYYDESNPKDKGWAYDVRYVEHDAEGWPTRKDSDTGAIAHKHRNTSLRTLRRTFFKTATHVLSVAGNELARAGRDNEWKAMETMDGWKTDITVDYEG